MWLIRYLEVAIAKVALLQGFTKCFKPTRSQTVVDKYHVDLILGSREWNNNKSCLPWLSRNNKGGTQWLRLWSPSTIPSCPGYVYLIRSRRVRIYLTIHLVPLNDCDICLFSWKARAKVIYRATKQHALNLAKFVSIYKTLLLIQKKLNNGKERNIDTFIAGLIGGYIVFGDRNAVNEQVCHRCYHPSVLC